MKNEVLRAVRVLYRIPVLGYLLHNAILLFRLPTLARNFAGLENAWRAQSAQFEERLAAASQRLSGHDVHAAALTQLHEHYDRRLADDLKRLERHDQRLGEHDQHVMAYSERLDHDARRLDQHDQQLLTQVLRLDQYGQRLSQHDQRAATQIEQLTTQSQRLDQYDQHLVALSQHLAAQSQRLDQYDEHWVAHSQHLDQHREALDHFRSALGELQAQFIDLRARHEQQQQEAVGRMGQVALQQAQQERRLGALLDETRQRLPAPLDTPQLAALAAQYNHLYDALYVRFEDDFRGSTTQIAERLRVYLPILQTVSRNTGPLTILDLGCGRGEWLALLTQEGYDAHGVDLNQVLIDDGRAQGLAVQEGDAVDSLRGWPDDSLGAITAFHLIEHLPLETLINLIDEAARALQPGGVLIFETPNPENVFVGSQTFYLDPTHRNPIPPVTARFLLEVRGLGNVEIWPLHPFPEAEHLPSDGIQATSFINTHFFGPRDYAVVGRKV